MKIRCPHCRNPMDVVEEEELNDITCHSCGSQFNLLSDEDDTVTFAEGARKQIGHFELTDQLGVGAFGSVYKAHDSNLDREVAIKIPRRSELSPEDTEKFLREARAAAQLKHPNIVGVHEIGRTDESVYIVSDYIQGADLKQWSTKRPYTCQGAAKLCQEVALALHHAHENGIVHRDLKPGNIMVDMDGNPYLTDFGLAKRDAGEITMTMEGQILGTPAYMSPEQAKGETKSIDRRSDIYSLGVVLYQLVTGVLPFRGQKRMLMVQIIQDDPPSPRKLRQNIPRDLETICLKALMKEPRQRYATAKDFADDLGRYLNNEPILARPVGNIEKSIKWCRNRPLAATLAGCLLLSIILGFAGVTWQWRKAVAATGRESQAKSQALASAEAEKKSALKATEAAQREAVASDRMARHLFAVNLNLAGIRYQSGLIFEAKKYLLHTGIVKPERFMAFENELLSLLCGVPEFEIKDSSRVNPGSKGVAISPDGNIVMTLSDSGRVRFWNGKDGSRLARLDDLEKQINESKPTLAAFAEREDQLAVADESGTVQIWDFTEAKLLQKVVVPHQPVNVMTFHPSQNALAIGTGDKTKGEGNLFWLELGSEETVREVGKFDLPVGCVQFSPDGSLVAASEWLAVIKSRDATAKIKIWQTSDFAFKSEFEIKNCRQSSFVFHPKLPAIISLGLNHSLKRVAKEVSIWNYELKKEIQKISLGLDLPGTIVVTKDGTRILTSGNQRIRVWQVDQGLRLEKTIVAHNGLVRGLACSKSSGSVISASVLNEDSVRSWEIESPSNPIELGGHDGWVRCVAYSPDGKLIATGSQRSTLKGDGLVIVYDARTFEIVSEQGLPKVDVESLCFSSQGDDIAVGCSDGSIRLFKAKNLESNGSLKSRKYAVTSVLFSSDDRFLYSADGAYRKLSPDGTYFDNYSTKGELRVWDIQKKSLDSTISDFEGAIESMVLTEPDTLVTATDKGFLSVWNMHSKSREARKKLFSKTITSLDYHPESNRMAIAGMGGPNANEVIVKIYDKDWNAIEADRGNRNAINVIRFSPDGKTLATAGFDGRICFLDPVAGHLRLSFSSKQIVDLAFSPDSKCLTVGATIKKALVYWTK